MRILENVHKLGEHTISHSRPSVVIRARLGNDDHNEACILAEDVVQTGLRYLVLRTYFHWRPSRYGIEMGASG